MRPRQLIIESLLKEASEEEKLAADLLDGVFDEIASDIKANKDALIPQQQNEAVGLAILGGVVAAPAMMKIIGKGVQLGQNALRKRKGEEPIDSNAIIEMAEKLHHMFIGGIEKALFFIKDKDKKHRLAVIIFHAVVAGLLVASGKGFFKALAKHQDLAAFLEAMLSAIKTGELGAFASETFAALAAALGTASDLTDAVELGEFEGMVETCTMAAGDVGGAAGGLGKKAKVYDIWNQKSLEETNMKKLKLTKGRLRQIIFEEVQRAKRLDEGGMSSGDPSGAEKAEGEEEASETDAAQYMIDEDHRDEEEWEKHDVGAAEDDWSQIHKLEKDARYDARRRRELREKVHGALEEMLSAEPVAEAKEAKKDYDGDGKVESSTEEWKGSRDKAIKKAEDK